MLSSLRSPMVDGQCESRSSSRTCRRCRGCDRSGPNSATDPARTVEPGSEPLSPPAEEPNDHVHGRRLAARAQQDTCLVLSREIPDEDASVRRYRSSAYALVGIGPRNTNSSISWPLRSLVVTWPTRIQPSCSYSLMASTYFVTTSRMGQRSRRRHSPVALSSRRRPIPFRRTFGATSNRAMTPNRSDGRFRVSLASARTASELRL